MKKNTLVEVKDMSRKNVAIKNCFKYHRQQNTLYPKGDRFCENNFLNLLIGSQPIIEGWSSICGRRG